MRTKPSVARTALVITVGLALAAGQCRVEAGEPSPSTYWAVKDVKPGMKGTGQTVMVGTKLEPFEATVLGVMRDVNPGRDMILCRLSGCNLEHAGIIQGMSGSPIYIDGKLLGAVAYAWEFAKDPIAGVTPFSQMVEYVRANDRKIAAEAQDRALARTARLGLPAIWDRTPKAVALLGGEWSRPATAGGMRAIAMPMAASGFSPRALAGLDRDFGALGMAPAVTGGVHEEILEREGGKGFQPGSPMCVAMVTGDFDLSAIGTVTHVEGDRVYGFGHPMFGLGACEFPLMTGYIHTVYPRASVSMKMGSPLKIVGVLDTDVSTGISGRIGPVPDLMPMSVKVSAGRYSEPRTYNVQIVRHPKMLSSLVMSVLTSAIDTEGELPEELTARLTATVKVKDREPIVLMDTVSGPRFTGAMGPSALFGPVSALASLIVRNAIQPMRIESITCDVEIREGRTTAAVEAIRLPRDRVAPGGELEVEAVLKPFQGERNTVRLVLTVPAHLAEGTYEVVVCDAGQSWRRRSGNQPELSEPTTVAGLLDSLRLQAGLKRSTLFAHVALPERGITVDGQALPSLPASVRSVLSDARQTAPTTLKSDLVAAAETDWVIEGSQTLKFRVDREAVAAP